MVRQLAQSAPAFVAAFVVALTAIRLLARASHRVGWVDRPGGDPLKIHARPIPLVGGAGIALGTVLALLFASGALLATPQHLALFLLPAIAVAAVGLYDDVAGLTPSARFGAELAAALTFAVAGLMTRLFVLSSTAGTGILALSAVVIALFLVGGINALNMQDGTDGLAGALALISCVGIFLVAAESSRFLLQQLSVALAGSLCAFLVYNLPPASVFMGDSGSYFLGLLIAAAAVTVAVADGTVVGFAGAALLVGLPLVDAGLAILRRLMSGRSPFQGDRDHLYDKLLQRGFARGQTLAIGCAFQIVLVGAGVLLLRFS